MIWKWLRSLKDRWMVKPHYCTNCGVPATGIVRCRMIGRCIPSQNSIIWENHDAESMTATMRAGNRIFTDEARVLCVQCAEDNHYVCYSCELESFEETKK